VRRSLVGVALALVACGDFPERLLQGDAGPPRDQQTADRALDVGSDLATCGTAPEGTVCGTRCKDPTTVLERTCTMAGACGGEQERSCEPFKCNMATGSCMTTCTSDADCVSGAFVCTAGWCLLPAGEPCTSPTDCASAFCVSGVCCDTACNRVCEACNVAGSVGSCTLIEAGQDPNDDCADLGPALCQTDGTCDGLGTCRIYAAGTECGASQCMPDGKVKVLQCDGIGACVPMVNDCFPYQCDATVHDCFTGCTTNNEDKHCAGNMECDSNNTCKSQCTGDGDCQDYWACNDTTHLCFTYCNTDNECEQGKDIFCNNKHECDHK